MGTRIDGLNRRAFTLVETLICATILSICLGMIVVFLPTGFLSLKDSERRLYAGSLAQRVLEERRNLPLEALDALGSQLQIVEEVDYDNTHYTVFLQVTRHPTVDFARKLKVAVEWSQHQRIISISRESTECRVRR